MRSGGDAAPQPTAPSSTDGPARAGPGPITRREVPHGVDGWLRLLAPALLGGLPALVAGAVDARSLGAPTVVHGDLALMSWDVQRASQGALLVGPYSRFGWHHPGPMLAYWLAPFWWLAGRHFAGLTVGAAALSALTCAVVVIAVGRVGGRGAAWLTAAAIPVLMWRVGLDVFREPWNPDVSLVALVGTGVLGAVVIAGRDWWLPALVFGASLAVQTHVGSLAAAGLVVLAASAAAVYRSRSGLRALLGPGVVTLAVGCACWSVPAYQQISARGGNISQLARFAVHDRAPLVGSAAVRRATALMLPLTSSGIGRRLAPEAALPPHPPGWINTIVVLALIAVVLVAVGRGIRRGRPLLVGLGAASGALVVAAIFSLATTHGVPYLYLAFPCVAAGIVAWLTAGAVLLDIVTSRPGAIDFLGRRSVRRVVQGSVCSVVLLCALGAANLPTAMQQHDDPVAAHFVQKVVRRIASVPRGSRIIVDSSGSRWPVAAAIAQHLQLRGYHIAAEPNWVFLYDASVILDGHERTRLLVIAGSPERRLLRHGDRLVDRYQQSELWIGP